MEHIAPYFEIRKTHKKDVLFKHYPRQHAPTQVERGSPSFIYHDDDVFGWFEIKNDVLRRILEHVIPSDRWEKDAVSFSDVHKRLGHIANEPTFDSSSAEVVELVVGFVEGKLSHELHDLPWKSWNWKHLSEVTAISSSSAHFEEASEAWPESFEQGDAYIDHLVDPQAHPINTEELEANIVHLHGLGPYVRTLRAVEWCNVPNDFRVMQEVAIHRKCLNDTLARHKLEHHTSPPRTPGATNHKDELGRRLKRLFVRKLLRKTLRDRCSVLRDQLSTANGSDQISLHELSALAKNPVRVWGMGLRAINDVLNNVSPNSVQEVISLILMADSMRTIPTLGAEVHCCLNEFKQDLHRWKHAINLGDLPIFETFTRIMYEVRVDGYTSPSPSPPLDLLKGFQELLLDILAPMSVPARSDAEIPITFDGWEDQADSTNTATPWSNTPPDLGDPGDPNQDFQIRTGTPLSHAVSRNTAAIVGTVIFGVVLACLLTWQSFVPVASDLKTSWKQHQIEDIGWSQSITRNSLIINLFKQSDSMDTIYLPLETSSHLSPSTEGHDDGSSHGWSPTLPTAVPIVPQISPQETTPSTTQQPSPQPSTLSSDRSTTSRRPQDRRIPCDYCTRVFTNRTNANRHMNYAGKCSGRPDQPQKVQCQVCGKWVGKYYIKNHRCRGAE